MNEDVYYLGVARAICKRGVCLRRRWGSVIVKDKRVVSTGYNGPPRGYPHCQTCMRDTMKCQPGEGYNYCPAVHSEINAIINCNPIEMKDATLYLVGEQFNGDLIAKFDGPCHDCKDALVNAQIKYIVIWKNDKVKKIRVDAFEFLKHHTEGIK